MAMASISLPKLPKLPNDILFLITAQLSNDQDFNTLFNCALASKDFAVGALTHLYRIHDNAPITSRGAKQADLDDSNATLEAWINLWRSLILSSIGATAHPYCRFVRVLDLRDLRTLLERLEEEKRQGKRKKTTGHRALFFEGDVGRFFIAARSPSAASSGGPMHMNIMDTMEMIGDQVTTDTPKLEELSADVTSDALQRWMPHLKYLREIRCFDGSTIEDTGKVLAEHCPQFQSLTIYRWTHDESDPGLASFLRALRRDTLKHLKIFSGSSIAAEAAAALAHHRHSLTSIDIGRPMNRTFLTNLPGIEVCTNLTTLKIDSITGSLPPDAADGMTKFLQRCTNLRDLTVMSTLNAPAILTPLLANRETRLERLQVNRYGAGGATGTGTGAEDPNNEINIFHAALTHQAGSLRALLLSCEGELCDPQRFSAAASELVGLTELRLVGLSDYFVTSDILLLCSRLSKLEELCVSGWSIGDDVWLQPEGFGGLPALRRLDFNAFAAPSFEALRAYMSHLRLPDNRGMALNVTMADPRSPLSEDEVATLGALIEERAQGRFEYALGRDPEAESDESDDD